MSTLVVVSYDDHYKAEEVRLKLRKLQSEHLVDLEDAVVASADAKGKVKLHAAVNLTAARVLTDGSRRRLASAPITSSGLQTVPGRHFRASNPTH